MAAKLVRLFSQTARLDVCPSRNSEADEDDDSHHHGGSDGDSAGEIQENVLNFHRDSVNLIGKMRNVTLVSIVVRAVVWTEF